MPRNLQILMKYVGVAVLLGSIASLVPPIVPGVPLQVDIMGQDLLLSVLLALLGIALLTQNHHIGRLTVPVGGGIVLASTFLIFLATFSNLPVLASDSAFLPGRIFATTFLMIGMFCVSASLLLLRYHRLRNYHVQIFSPAIAMYSGVVSLASPFLLSLRDHFSFVAPETLTPILGASVVCIAGGLLLAVEWERTRISRLDKKVQVALLGTLLLPLAIIFLSWVFSVSPDGTPTPLSFAWLLGELVLCFVLYHTIYSFVVARRFAEEYTEELNKDLKKGRDILAQARARDEAILQSIGDGVIVFNIDGNITLYNSAAQFLTGYTTEEAMGKPYDVVFRHVKEKESIVRDVYIHLALGGQRSGKANHTIIYKKDGTALPIAESVAPIIDNSGNVEGVVVVFRSIAEEEKISQMKSDFVSMVSHQLKTPSAQIMGFVDNMKDGLTGPITEMQGEYLDDIRKIATDNSRLIDDLLSVSRIERGILEVDISKNNIAVIIDESLAPLWEIAKKLGVELVFDRSLAEHATVSCDRYKSIEVVRNVVHNALKFTRPNTRVDVRVTERDDSIDVLVRDEGEGIKDEARETVFSREKVLGGRVRASGAGLGLFLAKEFMRLMKGDIAFETTIGKGTTFTITFKK